MLKDRTVVLQIAHDEMIIKYCITLKCGTIKKLINSNLPQVSLGIFRVLGFFNHVSSACQFLWAEASYDDVVSPHTQFHNHIRQSGALSSVLISCDIYQVTDLIWPEFWPNLGTVNTLIVPSLDASAAFQARLVSPWVFLLRSSSPDMRRGVPKSYNRYKYTIAGVAVHLSYVDLKLSSL